VREDVSRVLVKMFDRSNNRRVVFAVNSDLDSWEFENLKFIRKISTLDQDVGTFTTRTRGDKDKEETLTYISHSKTIYDEGTNTTRTGYKPPPKARVLKEEAVGNGAIFLPAPEDLCYVQDTVMIANESVPHRRQRSSSGSSSDSSLTSAISKGIGYVDVG